MKKKKSKLKSSSRRANRRQRASKSKAAKPTTATRSAASEIDLARFRAVFSLRKLSPQLQSDVMADGSVSKQFDIPTHRAAHLGPKTSLDQARLLATFRAILGGKTDAPLLDDNGGVITVTINFDQNGAAQLKTLEGGFSFANAGLLSPKPEARLEYLEAALKERTLASVHSEALRAKVRASALSDDEFLSVVEVLLTAQESFIQAAKAKMVTRELTNADLLPDNVIFWDNLIAPHTTSNDLEGFLANEREIEKVRLMSGDAVHAFQALSLSFCAPGLVPIDAFKNASPDAVLKVLERALLLPDHFAVAGAFEICADWLGRDNRIEAMGIRLLDQLFGKMNQLQDRCTFYAAIFAMTLARLAENEILRRKPAFWRRITAAAHSSLVLRACGSANAKKVYEWAIEHSGKAFLLSVFLEGDHEPRWKPEWLTGKHLVADVFGRVDAAINKVPEAARPTAWLDRVAKAREWIVTKNAELLCILPAIGESARKPMSTENDLGWFQPFFQELSAQPSVETLMLCAPGFYTVGVTDQALDACRTVMSQLQIDAPKWQDRNAQYVLQTLSFAAMLAQDAVLADSVADFCIEKARDLQDGESTIEIIGRLIECAQSNPNRKEAIAALTRRLEAVAFVAPPSALVDLHDSLKHIQILDEGLARNLGRAIAASRLGRKAA